MYAFSVLLLTITAGITLIRKRKKNDLYIALPHFLFFLIVAYSFINAQFFTGFFSLNHTYLLVCGLLLFSISIIFSFQSYRLCDLFFTVSVLAVFECVWCLLQYAGAINSLNEYIKVTGTWSNPNVTALFLAMAWPVVFWLMLSNKGIHKWVAAAILIVLTTALILLKCRTAYLGVGTSSCLLLIFRYKLLDHFGMEKTCLVRYCVHSFCWVCSFR